jgi:hypothetical protein
MNCCCFSQWIVFGEVGQLGEVVQKLVGPEPTLDIVGRLRLKALMDIVLFFDFLLKEKFVYSHFS